MNPTRTFCIDVYRYSDILKFLALLDKENGTLVSVVRYTGAGMGIHTGYYITYLHSSYIEMQVLC